MLDLVCGSHAPVALTACVASEARRLFTAANQQLNGKSRTWQRCDYPLYGYCWIQRILARMRHFQAGCVAGGVLTIHTQIKVCCMRARAAIAPGPGFYYDRANTPLQPVYGLTTFRASIMRNMIRRPDNIISLPFRGIYVIRRTPDIGLRMRLEPNRCPVMTVHCVTGRRHRCRCDLKTS